MIKTSGDRKGAPLRRRSLVAGLAGGLAAPFVVPGLAHAQRHFPTRPVRVICAYGAGGTADIVARIVFAAMSARLGQQFVVENRAGGAGQIAANAVVHAAADGYTLLYDATAHSVNPALFGDRLPYNTETDLLPIFLSMVAPNTINIGKSFAAHTVQQLIDLAKASPRGLDAASTGVGSAQHISIELFNMMAGVHLNHVVYRAAPDARNDMIAGRVAMQFGNVPGSVSLLQSDEVRVLAHAGLVPIDVLPGVPPIADTLPGYETYEWNGIFAPKGTSAEIIGFLNTELNQTIRDPEVAGRLRTLGAITRANTPEECAAFRRQQFELHARVVREAHITLE
ncbi:MAG TPA: tripartite tricarboxylate transporter substrate-binding protein [Roseomonas sp.]|jgi:tripartite-type tricarboxylate transporter receptor subunit TctC